MRDSLSIDDIRALNDGARTRGNGAGLNIPAIAEWVDEEKLSFVRTCRGPDSELPVASLRCTAHAVFDRFDHAPWYPSSNQLAGVDLCELAGIDAG